MSSSKDANGFAPENWLEGNGAGLVRERALASRVQGALERLYQLDRMGNVDEFIEPAEEGERESVLVRAADDGSLELSVRLPPLAQKDINLASGANLDPVCQLIEGVSHFVYIAERARAEREATQLELEIQAEVDKYVILAASVHALDEASSQTLRTRLYEDVLFATHEDEASFERYRVANELAARYVRRIERDFVLPKRFGAMQTELRRFFRMGQQEKIRAGRAA